MTVLKALVNHLEVVESDYGTLKITPTSIGAVIEISKDWDGDYKDVTEYGNF